MKKNRIAKEKRLSKILTYLSIFTGLFSLTLIIYFLAMFLSDSLGGLNIYTSAILAGAMGGLWSLGANMGYKHHIWVKNCSDIEWAKKWNTTEAFRENLNAKIMKIVIFLIDIVVLLILIKITGLT